jgi:hypothetical protein
MKSDNLNLMEASGPVQASVGIALPLLVNIRNELRNVKSTHLRALEICITHYCHPPLRWPPKYTFLLLLESYFLLFINFITFLLLSFYFLLPSFFFPFFHFLQFPLSLLRFTRPGHLNAHRLE